MASLALGKGLSMLQIDTAVADDNVGKMSISGSSVYFYMSTAEQVGKGVLLAPFRWLTFNTVQRVSYIVIYNVDEETRKQLELKFKLGNEYMSINSVVEVLNRCGKDVENVERREDRTYEDGCFKKGALFGIVGFEIRLL